MVSNAPRNLRGLSRQVHAVVRRFKEINRVQIFHFDNLDELREHVKLHGLGDGLLIKLRPPTFLSIYGPKEGKQEKSCKEANDEEDFPNLGVPRR